MKYTSRNAIVVKIRLGDIVAGGRTGTGRRVADGRSGAVAAHCRKQYQTKKFKNKKADSCVCI
jgi:tRNA-dihydrouridine synthase